MPPMIVALTGQKGGVGKSTTAIGLASAAFARGLRVLLVDADPQGTARTWGDVAAESGRRTPTVVAMGANMHRPGQLPGLAADYDLVVIDAPPRHGDVQRSALMIADLAIVPCGPSAADAWALASTLEMIEEARALRPELSACLLVTRKQGRTALGKGARTVLASSGLPLLATELGYRIAYQEALAAGMGVAEFAPRDPAAKEINALLTEVLRFAHGQEASDGLDSQAVVVAAE